MIDVEVLAPEAFVARTVELAGRTVRLKPAAPEVDVQPVGQARAPILAWLMPSRADFDAVAPALADRPLVLVNAGASVRADLRSAVQELAWATYWTPTEADAPALLAQWAQDVPPDTWHALHAAAAANAAGGLLSAFTADVQRDLQALRTRRALLQHRPAAVPASTGSDVITDLRTMGPRHVAELVRGLEERLHDAGSPTGPLWSVVERAVDAIGGTQREPRLRTTATRLSEADEHAMLTALRQALVAHGVADLKATHDLTRVIEREVFDRLSPALGPSSVLSFQPLTDDRLQRLVHVTVTLSKHYQGELPRPGFFEYLMIARRYQMVLVMLLSAFGFSFVRSIRDLMMPIGVLLLSLGALNVLRTVRRERVESEHRELERARDIMRAEARRMLQEFERQWPAIIAQHLQDQWPPMIAAAERALRDRAARDAAEASAARHRTQRQMQSYDALERRYATTARAREAVGSALSQLRGELKQLVTGSVLAVAEGRP